MSQAIMTRRQIMEVIPHRDPMLLVDEVVAHQPGEMVTARFWVDPKRDIFRGHFPDEPVLPGVYTVESMAQTADILLLSQPRYAGKVPLFLGIDKLRFQSKITPGSTIEIVARLQSERADKAIATCACQVLLEGAVAAAGEVTLAMR